MARTKKTAAVTSTAPKTRGIDVQEVEARVTALDKAKRRSYDIFDIEQRVYNLEKNGSTPTPTPTIQTFKRTKTDKTSGSYTVTEDTTLSLWTSISEGISSYYNMKINDNAWNLTSYFVSSDNVSNNCGYCLYENIPVSKGDVISWNVGYSNRYFIAFG